MKTMRFAILCYLSLVALLLLAGDCEDAARFWGGKLAGLAIVAIIALVARSWRRKGLLP